MVGMKSEVVGVNTNFKIKFCSIELVYFCKKQNIIIKSENKTVLITDDFHCYLFEKININNRLIAILRARGTGKITMLLQAAKNLEIKKIFLWHWTICFYQQ